jgi:predicted MFS family arabinose efflux permease
MNVEAALVHGELESKPSARLAHQILILLLLSYTVSYVDRTALGILQEQLKYDLKLTDWHLGLMSGPAFALLYAAAGIPIARLTERFDRRIILSSCLVVWSAMTMACGLAANFVQMFLARMGLGVGEAGGNPVAHSLIADLFPSERRGRAIAIYSLGAPAGAFLGAALVGWLAQQWDWRYVFLMLGPPGFLLALMVWFLVPPIRRGSFEANVQQEQAPPPFLIVLRRLLGIPAFRHAVAGASLVVLVGYGVASFLPPYLIRRHGLSLGEVGLIAGLVNGVAAALGTLAGGYWGDRLSARHRSFLGIVPAVSVFLAAPLLVIGFAIPHAMGSMVCIFLATMLIYGYIAPTFALVHALSSARSRATAAAIFYLIINLVGMGSGPPLIGALSDHLTSGAFRALPEQFHILCTRADAASSVEMCREAMASGLTSSLMIVSAILLWASFHFWMVGRSLSCSHGEA